MIGVRYRGQDNTHLSKALQEYSVAVTEAGLPYMYSYEDVH